MDYLINKGLMLYQVYPYTFKLGEWLTMQRPDWFSDYQEQQDYLLPMEQAMYYHFASYAEASYPDFYQAIKPFFTGMYLQELENTIADLKKYQTN